MTTLCFIVSIIPVLVQGQTLVPGNQLGNCNIKDIPNAEQQISGIVREILSKILNEKDALENKVSELQDQLKTFASRIDKLELERTEDRTTIDDTQDSTTKRQKCPDEWIKNGTSCYRFVKQLYTWTDAKAYCETVQSHMVKIDTSTENNFLKRQLRHIFNYPTSTDAIYQHWIGGSDADKEGTWRWTSGSQFLFTDWGHKSGYDAEPNDGRNANCATMFKSLNYQWNDTTCSRKFTFICEKPI